MDNYVIYSRKSRFTEKGDSIDNQIKMCKDYIYSRFSNVNEESIYVFEDEGFSGKNTNRPQFQKMMEGINKNKFKYVICYKLDRISRSIIDFSSLIHDLDAKGIKFISIKEQFDTTTPMGRAMMFISAVFAQMERETIAERVRDNLMLLARTGRWLGGTTPTGFTKEKTTEFLDEGKIKTASYLKENDDMKIIKLIFEKFLELGSVCSVVRYLEKENIRTINNKFFSRTTVKKILRQPLYCSADKNSFEHFNKNGSTICFGKQDFKKGLGIISFNRLNETRKYNDKSKWVIALGKHEGMVSGKDWVAIQNILDKSESIPRTFSKVSLISGLIICEKCGSRMYSKLHERTKKDTKTFSYVCHKKVYGSINCCNSLNLPGKKTDAKVVDYVMNFDESELKKELNIGTYSRKANKFDDKIDELRFEIKKLEKNKQICIEHLMVLSPSSPLVKDLELKVKRINIEIKKLIEQKRVCESDFELATTEKSGVEQILKNLKNFKENFHNLDFDNKKSLLRLVVDKLTWNGKDLKIFLIGEKT